MHTNLPKKVQQLLAMRPKPPGEKNDYQPQAPIFYNKGYEVKEKKPEFSLGLEDYFKNRPKNQYKQQPIEKASLALDNLEYEPQHPIDQMKTNEFLGHGNVDMQDFLHVIPNRKIPLHQLIPFQEPSDKNQAQKNEQEEEKKILHIIEEEKTKQFLIEALSDELTKLDAQSRQLEDIIGQNQQLMNNLRFQNDELETTVKAMFAEKQMEEKIHRLEEALGVDQLLRLKLDDRMDQQKFNDALNMYYEDNERLYKMADEIMGPLQHLIEQEESSDESPTPLQINRKARNTIYSQSSLDNQTKLRKVHNNLIADVPSNLRTEKKSRTFIDKK